MRRGDTLSQLPEEGIHDLLELGGLDDIEYLFELVEEHDLLRRVGLRPELEEILDNRLRQRGVLLEELHDAVGQLRMVDRQRFGLVQRQQHLQQERLVLLLQRQCEPVDNTANGKYFVLVACNEKLKRFIRNELRREK